MELQNIHVLHLTQQLVSVNYKNPLSISLEAIGSLKVTDLVEKQPIYLHLGKLQKKDFLTSRQYF